MNNEIPLLTIFIPTYNRIDELKKTIDMFYKEILKYKLGNEIEIIIGDNASDDGTATFLEESNLEYFRNEKNLGITKNILKGIDFSRGNYLWIFGDDDIINPDLLIQVIQVLRHNSVNSIWLSSKSFHNEDLLEFIEPKSISISSYSFLKEFELNPVEIELDSGFISSHIVNTEKIKNVINNYKDKELENNNYYNKLIMYNIFLLGKSFKSNKKVIYKRITNGSNFSNNIEVINKTFIQDINILYKYYKDININIYNFLLDYNSKRYLLYFLIRLLHNDYKKIMINEYKIYGKLYFLFLNFIPKVILKTLYFFYKKIKGTDYPLILQKNV